MYLYKRGHSQLTSRLCGLD